MTFYLSSFMCFFNLLMTVVYSLQGSYDKGAIAIGFAILMYLIASDTENK